ncbi:glycoside hydrolase family 127 protein [candidate division KSB1 bacterium]
MNRLLYISLLCLFVLMTAMCADAPDPGTDLYEFKANPFPLSRVTLLDSPFKDAMERTGNYLRFIDADRMLYSFRENYGLPTLDAEPPRGWESPEGKLRGHSMGHILVALAQAYASTGELEYKTKAEYIIAELGKCQDLSESRGYSPGYLSAYGEYQFEELEQLQTYPNIWAPYYTQHKIISGLIACYYNLESEKALDIAGKMGDWIYSRLSKVDDAQLQKMWDIYIAGEYGGMNEVLAELHAITGESNYLAAARYFDHDKIFIPCAADEDKLSGNHANQTIPKITGALRIFDQTGEQKYYDIAANFWKMVTGSHMYIIGGTSEGEMFKDPGLIGSLLTDRTCETCCTYNLLKLTKQLFMHDPRAEYIDYYERGLYNQILASQDPRSEHGFTTYFIPLKPGGVKRYSSNYRSFSCCHGTGMENHTKYGESIYFHDESGLWVNLFIPSELDWKEKNVTILQETAYPEQQGTEITVRGSGKFAIKIRHPVWLEEGFAVKINGLEQQAASEPGSYINLDREWKNGDRITVDLPFRIRVEYTEDVPDVGGVMYGPVLLGSENVNSLRTLNINLSEPERSFTQDTREPLRFYSNNTSLIPFYKIYGTSYSVYFKMDSVRVNRNRRR